VTVLSDLGDQDRREDRAHSRKAREDRSVGVLGHDRCDRIIELRKGLVHHPEQVPECLGRMSLASDGSRRGREQVRPHPLREHLGRGGGPCMRCA
jgi:hypothetical protein